MDLLDVLLGPLLNWDEDLPPPKGLPEDIVYVRDVQIEANIGPDAWGRDKPQPVIVSAKIPFSVQTAGESDDIADALDYRTLYKVIRNFNATEPASAVQFGSLAGLADDIAPKLGPHDNICIDIAAPKALLHSSGVQLRLLTCIQSRKGEHVPNYLGIAVKAMHIPCIIGIGKHERLQKQPVIVDFAVSADKIDIMKRSVPIMFNKVFEVASPSI
jgi:FolB domain-containing protein